MLRKHAHTLSMMTRDGVTKYLIRDYFDLPRWQALTSALLTRGLGQADLVLALLRLRDASPRAPHARLLRAYVELLVGHPIVIGPNCLLRYRVNGPPALAPRRTADERRLTYVAPDNPRQPRTEAHLRWREFRVGRTISQLRSRGVTKRDLRRATRRGWIVLEELAS